MVDYGKTLSDAVKFSIEPRRWLPMFVLDAVCFTAVLSYLISNVFTLRDIIAANVQGLVIASSIISVFGITFIVFGVWMLVRLYISGALIHQSVKPKESRQSWTVARQRYLSIIAVALIVGIISTIVAIIPYAGWIVSIVIGLMFFFALPAVVAGKMSFDNAMTESFKLFRNRFSEVFVAWLLITVISGLILFIFMIPVLVVAWTILMPVLIGISGKAAGPEVLSAIISRGWSLVPAGLVFLVGSAIVTVFGLHAQTHFYIQLTKKKLGIL